MAIYALYGVAVLLALAPIAVVLAASPRASNVIYGACLVVALVLCVVGVISLLGRTSSSVTLPLGLPWLGAHFRIDALAAFFMIVVNLGGAAASLFAIGYGQHEQAPERVLPFYPAYLAGMNLVVLSDDAFSFLVSWEFMSLSSWALVVAHHWERENLRAGYIYLLMASFGTLALLLGFGLLAGANGNYAFDAIRASHPSAALAALVLILALIGAGSKAGIVPLHAWLPLAHPAAPSHVSALMSGVMTKVAVYGFIRIAFDLLGAPEWWWSMLVLAAGGITAVMGVLYALMQHDLKRLLAYHTVENIGIIYIGLGLALAFKAHGMAVAAALALTAGLLHVFNHSHLQELVVLRRRRRAQFYRRTRHGASRRPDPSHAADRFRISCRLCRNLGAASAQRLRIGMADVPGHFAQPATTILGFEIPRAGGGRAVGAIGGVGSRMFCESVRRELLGAPAYAGGRHRARNRQQLTRCNVLSRRAVSRRWRPTRHLYRCVGACDQCTGRHEYAASDRP